MFVFVRVYYCAQERERGGRRRRERKKLHMYKYV